MTVRSFYDRAWRGGGSDRDARCRLEADRDALDSLEPLSGATALDVGVGTGQSVETLMRRGARVTAVDLSVEALLRTRARVGREAWLVQADAQRLPFRDGAFDRIGLFSVLMFLDLQIALPELDRVLKSAGRAALVEPVSGNPIIAVWRAITGRYRDVARWHDAPSLREALSRTFQVIDWRAYYLLPPGTLLPEGIARTIWNTAERAAMRLGSAANMAWIVRAQIEKR